MFRRVITSYLIAIALAGPGLCCCSVNRAFARDRAPAGRSYRCNVAAHSCCHSDRDSQSPGKPDKCPCRKHHEQPIVSLDDGSSPAGDALGASQWRPNFASAMAVIDALFAAGDPSHLAQQALDATHLTSQALLRALSVMRC